MSMKRTMHVDLTDEQVQKIQVGSKITLKVQGKVKRAEGSEKPDPPEEEKDSCCRFEGFPASVYLENIKVELEDSDNEFEELSED